MFDESSSQHEAAPAATSEAARSETARASAPPVEPGWFRRWGVIGSIVAVCLGVNILLPLLNEFIEPRGFDEQIMLALGFAGIICGQCCFVVLLSGLKCQSWLNGFLLGIALMALGFLAFCCGAWLIDANDAEPFAFLFMLPALLLSATAPLYGFYLWRGWRLAVAGEVAKTRLPLSIADLFSITAILAASLVLARAPAVIWENDLAEYWLAILITCSIVFGVGLTVMPLSAWLAFGVRSRARSWGGLILLACCVFAVLLLILQLFLDWNASWNERWELARFLLALVGGAVGMYYAALLALALSGLRLIRHRRGAGEEKLPLAPAAEALRDQAKQRARTRWTIAGAILVTTIVSIYLAQLESWRSARDRENARLQDAAQALGGDITVSDRQVTALSLGARARDNDLDVFQACRQIETLDLSSMQLTDEGCAQLRRFIHLSNLNLSGSRITDDGLRHLSALQHLSWVDLSKTHVSGRGLKGWKFLRQAFLDDTQVNDAGLASLTDSIKLEVLSLKNTPITDQGMLSIRQFYRLSQISLGKTAITDDGIAQLGGLTRLQDLDLSDTRITGGGLWAPLTQQRLTVLNLAGTAIDDQGIKQLQGLPALHSLNVARTQLTDSCLPELSKLPCEELDLSFTKITAQAILKHGLPSVSTLTLDAQQASAVEIRQLKTAPRLEVRIVPSSK